MTFATGWLRPSAAMCKPRIPVRRAVQWPVNAGTGIFTSMMTG